MSKYVLPSFTRAPVRRGSVGPDVVLLQELLTLEDFPLERDGDFGPKTEAAVKAFQVDRGIKPIGVVDEETAIALVDPYECASRAFSHSEPPASYADAVVRIATMVASYEPRELPDNRGPWVRLFMDGKDGPKWAWCTGFARHVLRVASDWTGKDAPLEVSTSCDITGSRAKAAGLLVTRPTSPLPGWLLLRRSTDPTTDGPYNHIEIVTGMTADGKVQVIAGNTNDNGSREGVKVCPHTHRLDGYDAVRL